MPNINDGLPWVAGRIRRDAIGLHIGNLSVPLGPRDITAINDDDVRDVLAEFNGWVGPLTDDEQDMMWQIFSGHMEPAIILRHLNAVGRPQPPLTVVDDPIWDLGRIERAHNAWFFGQEHEITVTTPLTDVEVQAIVREVDSWESPLTADECHAIDYLSDSCDEEGAAWLTTLIETNTVGREDPEEAIEVVMGSDALPSDFALPQWTTGRVYRRGNDFSLDMGDDNIAVAHLDDGTMTADVARTFAKNAVLCSSPMFTGIELRAISFILAQVLSDGEVEAWRRAMGAGAREGTYRFLPLGSGEVGRIRRQGNSWEFGPPVMSSWHAAEPLDETRVRAILGAVGVWEDGLWPGELEIVAYLAYRYLPVPNARHAIEELAANMHTDDPDDQVTGQCRFYGNADSWNLITADRHQSVLRSHVTRDQMRRFCCAIMDWTPHPTAEEVRQVLLLLTGHQSRMPLDERNAWAYEITTYSETMFTNRPDGTFLPMQDNGSLGRIVKGGDTWTFGTGAIDVTLMGAVVWENRILPVVEAWSPGPTSEEMELMLYLIYANVTMPLAGELSERLRGITTFASVMPEEDGDPEGDAQYFYNSPTWTIDEISRNNMVWQLDGHTLPWPESAEQTRGICGNLCRWLRREPDGVPDDQVRTDEEYDALFYIFCLHLGEAEAWAWLDALGGREPGDTDFLALQWRGQEGRISKDGNVWSTINSQFRLDSGTVNDLLSAAQDWSNITTGELELLRFLAHRYLERNPAMVYSEGLMRPTPSHTQLPWPSDAPSTPVVRTRGIRLPGLPMIKPEPEPEPVLEPKPTTRPGLVTADLPSPYTMDSFDQSPAGNPAWVIRHPETEEIIGRVCCDEEFASLIAHSLLMRRSLQKTLAMLFIVGRCDSSADREALCKAYGAQAHELRELLEHLFDQEPRPLMGVEATVVDMVDGLEDPPARTRQCTLTLSVPNNTSFRLVDGTTQSSGIARQGSFIYVYNPQQPPRDVTVIVNHSDYDRREVSMPLPDRSAAYPLTMRRWDQSVLAEDRLEFISWDDDVEGADCAYCGAYASPPALLSCDAHEEDEPGIHVCAPCYTAIYRTAYIYGTRSDGVRQPLSMLAVEEEGA